MAPERKLTLSAAGGKVGVEHSTWSEWESGTRNPSLERALDIERVTEGLVAIEEWGFPATVAAGMRSVIARRDAKTTPDGAPLSKAG
jgi:transcriptional regulator with XRE-family HTH domain